MKPQKIDTVLHTDERADELAVPEPKASKVVMSARAETARERAEELAGQAILLAALAATPEPEPVTAEGTPVDGGGVLRSFDRHGAGSSAPVVAPSWTKEVSFADPKVAESPSLQTGAMMPDFAEVEAYLADRQEEGDRIARDRTMAPVREARDRMKPSVQRLLETKAEILKLRAQYLPTLERLSKIDLYTIHLTERGPRLKDAAWKAMRRLKDALSQIDPAQIAPIDDFIRRRYTDLKPEDCIGRDAARVFERHMEAEFGAGVSAKATRDGFMQMITELYENLLILQKYLAPPEPPPTINIGDLRPVMPKTEEDAQALARLRESHAKM